MTKLHISSIEIHPRRCCHSASVSYSHSFPCCATEECCFVDNFLFSARGVVHQDVVLEALVEAVALTLLVAALEAAKITDETTDDLAHP